MTLAQPVPALLLCAGLVLLSALVVQRMIGLAVLDVPGARSSHDRPVPKGGGVGVLAAILVGTPGGLALLPAAPGRIPAMLLLLTAVLLLGAVSWLDDVRQFGFQAKLGAQLLASLLAIGSVLCTVPTLPPTILLPPIVLAALCWLLLVTNAVNFIDGLNGLAAGSIALLCLVAGAAGWRSGDPLLMAVALSTSFGLLGFLPFNYPKARIFLGDVGSQVCGLVAGTLALMMLADDPAPRAALLVPGMLVGILWDVLWTMARRYRAGARLTQAHRTHLYQLATPHILFASSTAVLHWSFVLWSVLVVRTAPLAIIPLLIALPQVVWTIRVEMRGP